VFQLLKRNDTLPWQNVLITKPTKLSIKNNNLKVSQQDRQLTLPLDDIATITLESPQIVLTMPVLAACAERGIALIVCDAKHTPCGAMLPLGQHSKAGAVAARQQGWPSLFRTQLWSKITEAKVTAQRDVLLACGVKSARIERILKEITSDNAAEKEAQAARIYWPLLFGDDFKRQEMSTISFALDYAYSIVRAAVARALVAYGFHTAWGVHHKHPQNAFNLADDFIEPFRPFIDWWVRGDGTIEQNTSELTTDQRARLTQALQIECKVDGKLYSLQTAIDRAAQSLVTATTSLNASHIKLPSASKSWRLSETLPDG
jgi:CRISP-associated protein Cas1